MKEALRKLILQKRRALPIKQKKFFDKKIRNRLFQLKVFKEAKTVFLYVSKEDEVDTHEILNGLLKQNKKAVVPKIHTKLPHLHLVHLDEIKNLKRGKFGILEPKSPHPRVKPDEIDVAIIPGVAFDKTGHRIGYGKGYFDRILHKIKTPKIGLAYDFQMVDKIQTHIYDMPVSIIITNKKTYDCSANF